MKRLGRYLQFWFVLLFAGAVLCIVAAVNAGDGKRYRYPWIFRLIA